MLTPVLFVLCFFIIVLVIRFRSKDRDKNKNYLVADLFMLPYTAFMVGAVGFMVAISSGVLVPHVYKKYTEGPVVSMRDSSGVQGNFFLGSGMIKSQLVYYFFTGDEQQGYVSSSAPAELSRIYEEDRTDGAYAIFVSIVDPSLGFIRWFVIDPGNLDSQWAYEFHIPKGSIKMSYSLG